MRIVQQPSSGGRVAGARRNGGLILTLVLELNPSVRLRHRKNGDLGNAAFKALREPQASQVPLHPRGTGGITPVLP